MSTEAEPSQAAHLAGRLWPLPALLTWLAAWAVFKLGLNVGLALPWAGLFGCAVGVLGALWGQSPWRRALMAVGFPLSWGIWLWRSPPVTTGPPGALGLDAWAYGGTWGAWEAWVQWAASRADAALWLIPVALLALIYPMRAWGDAPLFPTPRGALDDVPLALGLAPAAKVLDAGCGLGAGLREWRRVCPQASLEGWEWSLPLQRLCALRCPWATVRRKDIWVHSWGEFEVVYLFQRPESMPRAWAKASSEMRSGSWLISLEFEVPGQLPEFTREPVSGKPIWAYRVPASSAA